MTPCQLLRKFTLAWFLACTPLVAGAGPAPAGFSPTGGMAYPRADHTATLLQDGRVLVTGGFTNTSGGVTNTAEIYDPRLRRFFPVGPMVAPRAGATATLMPDGRVLITEGYNYPAGFMPSTLASAELFDPISGTFQLTYGAMSFPRTHHAAVLLRDGRVLITAGGDLLHTGEGADTAELYDPSSSTFLPLPKMLTIRRDPMMFPMAERRCCRTARAYRRLQSRFRGDR